MFRYLFSLVFIGIFSALILASARAESTHDRILFRRSAGNVFDRTLSRRAAFPDSGQPPLCNCCQYCGRGSPGRTCDCCINCARGL